jgi:hypothetical protein
VAGYLVRPDRQSHIVKGLGVRDARKEFIDVINGGRGRGSTCER